MPDDYEDIEFNEKALTYLVWLLSHNSDFFKSGMEFCDWVGTPEFARAVNPATAYIAPPWARFSQNASYFYEAAFGPAVDPQDAWDALDDLVDHDETDFAALGLTILHTLPLIIMSLRIYSRVLVLRSKIRMDDWFIVAAVFCTVVIFVLDWAVAEFSGSGWHIWDLTAREMLSGPPLSNSIAIMFILVLFFIKLSFLAFYRTLYSHPTYQRALLVVFVVLTLGTIGTIITYLLHVTCGALNAVNAPSAPGFCDTLGTLRSAYISNMFNNVFLVVGDFAVLCLFVPVVWLLKRTLMPTDLATVIFLFAVATLAPIAGTLRAVAAMKRFSNQDMMIAQLEVGLWMSVEVNIAVICGSAPALKALFSFDDGGWRSIGFLTPFFRGRNHKDAIEMGEARHPVSTGIGTHDVEEGSVYSGEEKRKAPGDTSAPPDCIDSGSYQRRSSDSRK